VLAVELHMGQRIWEMSALVQMRGVDGDATAVYSYLANEIDRV
jgi:hypothetical protein